MPLTEIHEFLNIVNRRDGVNGQLSLFLYHAVMFSATAFVDMSYLREAGYSTRKAARKSFFQKTRVSAIATPDISPLPILPIPLPQSCQYAFEAMGVTHAQVEAPLYQEKKMDIHMSKTYSCSTISITRWTASCSCRLSCS